MGSLEQTQEHAEFIALAVELRKLGAVRVRSGAHEVAFSAPAESEPDNRPTRPDPELEAARRLVRERREELG